jgi:hypothetical protein|eukprot:COSAG06_NODE_8248_length_2226_cov_11053.947269_2_plen_50_part_00
MLWRMRERPPAGGGGYDAAKLPALEAYIARNVAKPAVARTLTEDWWWWW